MIFVVVLYALATLVGLEDVIFHDALAIIANVVPVCTLPNKFNVNSGCVAGQCLDYLLLVTRKVDGFNVIDHVPTVSCYYSFNWHTFILKTCYIIIGAVIVITLIELIKKVIIILESPVGNVWITLYINLLVKIFKQPLLAVCTTRSLFLKALDVKFSQGPLNHTHPHSAMVRNNSSIFITNFAASLGLRPYFVQQSISDQRNKRPGCRSYFWDKDLSAASSLFSPLPTDILAFVDVDMYLDMPYWLANYPRTFLISTFQPSAVCYSGDEYSFTFNVNSEVDYNVSGGAKYRHLVWNYSGDMITAISKRCLYYDCTVFNVDRRQIDPHHQIILLTPIKTFSSFIDPKSFLSGIKLERLKLVVSTTNGDFLRMNVVKSDDIYRSTAKVNSFNGAFITAAQDDTIASIAALSKVSLTIAQVKGVLDETEFGQAACLTEFHRSDAVDYTLELVYPVEESIQKYQFDPKSFDPEAKVPLKAFMSPLLLDCYVPVRSLSNDIACIKGRIEDVKAPDNLELTPFLSQCINEWIELLIPVPHKGVPKDFDYVFERQDRPRQRSLLEEGAMSVDVVGAGPIKSFQKAEAYQEIKYPRNISTIPSTTKLHYSTFVYSFTEEIMVPQRWYAFGKTPAVIAESVSEICQSSSVVVSTDLDKMDGRKSKILRDLEHRLMVRYFREEYLQQLNELMASQLNQKAYTSFGHKYDTGFSQLSGGPDTAEANTGDNAFLNFCTLRRTRRNGAFLNPRQAFMALGEYGGDDGLTGDIDPNVLAEVCTSVGQKLTVDVVYRGNRGVNFLARYYTPDVWFGGIDSMCDLRRQISKFHTTHALPDSITAFRKLGEKALGYYLTDKNTPVIGDLVRLVVESFPEHVPSKAGLDGLRGVASYWSKYSSDVQYPNEFGLWMFDELMLACPKFDNVLFLKWIELVKKGHASILSPPLCEPSPVIQVSTKAPAVLNGDIVLPKPNIGEMPVRMCKLFLEGKCTYGNKCKFSHESGVKVNCKNWLSGGCKFGVECKFAHPPKPA